MKKLSQEEVVDNCKQVHGDKYSYTNFVYKGMNTPTVVICKEHGEFTVRPSNHITKKSGCPKCAHNKKDSKTSFVEKAERVHGGKFDYSKVEYIASNSKVSIICNKGHKFEQTPNKHLMGQGCPVCSGKRPLSADEFICRSREVHGCTYDYSRVVWKNTKTKVAIVCPYHGVFEQSPNIHMNGSGCPACGYAIASEKINIQRGASVDKLQKANVEKFGGKYLYEKTHVSSASDRITITCPEHGDFTQLYYNHISGYGCPKCGVETIREQKTKTFEHFEPLASSVHEGEYTYDKDSFCGMSKPVHIECPKHGWFWQTASTHTNGSRCPKCAMGSVSKGETELFEFVATITNSTQSATIPSTKLELDILTDVGVAFEFDGNYFHSEEYKTPSYHLLKTELCEKNGIRLIHFFEDEWYHRKDICKSIIRNILGETPEKIHARKCIVQEVDAKTARQFLDTNHIQGAVDSPIRIGLVYGEEIVSLMSFSSPRVNMGGTKVDGSYELVRFCNKLNTTVVGGASKLLSHFEKEYSPKLLRTYADKRLSNGALYNTLGFTHIRDSKPNYFYVINNLRENRYKYRKSELLKAGYDRSMSEKEIMLSRGIYRIYDCGTKVFLKSYK